jgi:hypothetical protein
MLSLNPFFMTFDGTPALLGLSNKAAERAPPLRPERLLDTSISSINMQL